MVTGNRKERIILILFLIKANKTAGKFGVVILRNDSYGRISSPSLIASPLEKNAVDNRLELFSKSSPSYFILNAT